MSHQGGQEVKLRRSTTKRSRGASTSHKEDHDETTLEGGSQELEKLFKCSICLNVLSNPYIIPECCHHFCCDCIHEYIQSGKYVASRQSLLTRLLKVRSKVEMTRSKEKTTTSLQLENEETNDIDEQALNELEESKNELTGSKKRIVNLDEKSGQTHKKRKWSKSIFEKHVKNLQKFKEKNGHCDVPQNYKDDTSLGNWVNHVRHAYKQIQLGKKPTRALTKSKICLLEKMGFHWEICRSFDMQIIKLQQFKVKNGHCNVPRIYKDDPPLGHWVKRIRHCYKQIQLGEKPRQELTKSNIEQLDEMGFRWELHQSFDVQFIKLQQYKKKYGNCNVPSRYKDDPPLRRWVGTRRQAYKQIQQGKKPKALLTQTMIEKLDEMGFQWKVRK